MKNIQQSKSVSDGYKIINYNLEIILSVNNQLRTQRLVKPWMIFES